jgi:hypothetical protein
MPRSLPRYASALSARRRARGPSTASGINTNLPLRVVWYQTRPHSRNHEALSCLGQTMRVDDHLCRNPAIIPRKVGKHVRIVLARSREVAEHPRISAPELAHFAERVQEGLSGELAMYGSISTISVALTPSHSSSTASGLKASLLNSSAISSHGSSGSLSSSARSRKFCKQTSGGCHPPVN